MTEGSMEEGWKVVLSFNIGVSTITVTIPV